MTEEMAKKTASRRKKAKPRRPPQSPPPSPVPAPQPKRNWRRWGAAAAGLAAAGAGAALLARYGLPAWRRQLDGRVDGTIDGAIDATPAAGTYDDGSMADVVVEMDPAEKAYLETVPFDDIPARNAYINDLLGKVADDFHDQTPQHKLARYLQRYILYLTADGSRVDDHTITSQRTGETVRLYSALAPLLELAEPRLLGVHNRARASGDLYDVQYEF